MSECCFRSGKGAGPKEQRGSKGAQQGSIEGAPEEHRERSTKEA